jgi:hypothetical protein
MTVKCEVELTLKLIWYSVNVILEAKFFVNQE